MIRDECDCDTVEPFVNTPQGQRITHLKCKVIKLMEDQMVHARYYISESKKKSRRRWRIFPKGKRNKCFYFLLILLFIFVLWLLLLIGAMIGGSICGVNSSSGSPSVF